MTRVSENSQRVALDHLLGKTKSKLEDLQLKGTSLKRVTKPSDDPLANVEAMSIGTVINENKQYLRNVDFALMQLNITDRTLEELTEVLAKAKEIGISQSSDFYDVTIRKNVANEIYQLRNMALGIANKRIGNRYIFSGHKTLTRPFDANGDYFGDRGALQVEITKDFFLPININGEEVFYSNDTNNQDPQLLRQEIESLANASQNNLDLSSENQDPLKPRDPASEASNLNFKKRENIFSQLSTLIVGLETNDTKLVQSLLEKLDGSINRMITLRTKIGSIISSVETARGRMDSDFVDHSARRSKLIDADVGELFTDLQRQQTILSTAYKSGQTSLNQSLMDFLK